MNERLNITDLVALLVEYTGKDKDFTEQFLRELIAVVSDALLEEGIVKVKGLGTFKVITVEERESIHVNTGERFVIPSHSKFTFTPDKDLKEQVNKPFASFETTELNEGVTFPDNYSDNKDEEELEDELEEVDDEVDVTPEPKKEETPVLPEPEPEMELEPDVEERDELSRELPEDKNPDVKKEEKETVQTEINPQPIVAESHKEVLQKKPEKRKSLLIVIGLIAVVFVFVGVYFFIDYLGKQNKTKPETNKQEQAIVSKPQPVEEKKTPEIIEPEPPAVEEVEAPQKAVVPENLEKPVIKVKIVPDTRLTLIALEYYGHKAFWVYIYEHNKAVIDNPNHIRIGTELIIPDAALYGIDAKNPESIARAKAKQAEINSKF